MRATRLRGEIREAENRRHLARAPSAGAAVAQPAKSLKALIVGTWNFVVAEVAAPDAKKSFPFGETPKGILIFTADGRFAQIHVAADVPRIASNNRMPRSAGEGVRAIFIRE